MLAHLGAMLAHLGAMVPHLGAMLAHLGGYVAPSWGYVGPSWGLCWPMLTHLEPHALKNGKNDRKTREFLAPRGGGGGRRQGVQPLSFGEERRPTAMPRPTLSRRAPGRSLRAAAPCRRPQGLQPRGRWAGCVCRDMDKLPALPCGSRHRGIAWSN